MKIDFTRADAQSLRKKERKQEHDRSFVRQPDDIERVEGDESQF